MSVHIVFTAGLEDRGRAKHPTRSNRRPRKGGIICDERVELGEVFVEVEDSTHRCREVPCALLTELPPLDLDPRKPGRPSEIRIVRGCARGSASVVV